MLANYRASNGCTRLRLFAFTEGGEAGGLWASRRSPGQDSSVKISCAILAKTADYSGITSGASQGGWGSGIQPEAQASAARKRIHGGQPLCEQGVVYLAGVSCTRQDATFMARR